MLFGGTKSKLRALVSPWHTGTVWLYDDHKIDLPKITDFDPASFRPGIRESLYNTWAASLASELVIQTRASGEYGRCWILVNAFLDGMDGAEHNDLRPALLRFLWRYLGLLGVRPGTGVCVRCETALGGGVYAPGESGFVCAACGGGREAPAGGLAVSDSALGYLRAVSTARPGAARVLVLAAGDQESLRALLFYLIQQAVGGLKTLETGRDVL
jgi:DNA repair protein RecO (recombination protein O)